MTGDVVATAVDVGGGAFDADAVLRWLADCVRALRSAAVAPCGAAGRFTVESDAGTVEIHPLTKVPMAGYSRRVLGFEASAALEAVIGRDLPTEDLLAPMEAGDPIATAFGRALVIELVTGKRAAIGNFGTWTIGQKPSLERFVRFRPSPAINRML